MPDYSIITNHTNYGMELIASDPSMAFNLANQADTDVREATNGNYGISAVIIDFENNMTYYDLAPLSVSAQMEMQQASLGNPSLGWLETLKNIISVIVAVVVFVIGALVGGWAFLAGAVLAAGILVWNWTTNEQEYRQDITDIDQEYARKYADGEITLEQFNELTEAKHKTMEQLEMDWKTIVIYGLIGLGALIALNMVLRRK